MTPRMRFGCGGGVFCAAGFALSDCCPAACVPLGCVPWRSASATLAPAAVVDNAAPESCESASAVTEVSCANENRAPPQIIAPVRNSVPIRRKAQPPYPKQTYPQSDASSGHEVTRTPRRTSRADSHQDPFVDSVDSPAFPPTRYGVPILNRCSERVSGRIPVRMRRPSAARETLSLTPLMNAHRADAASVERVPLVTAGAKPFVLFAGRP